MKFSELGLDPRLTQALTANGLTEPTPIQEAAIPVALSDHRDVIAMARTGSGKTIAYLLPVLQSLLDRNDGYALVVVPSRELAEQIVRVLGELTQFASSELAFVNIAPKLADDVRAALLSEPQQLVIATPASAVEQLRRGSLGSKTLRYIVFDEADLLSSYGYKEEVDELRKYCEASRPQVWLMGATLGADIDEMKKQWCTAPVSIKLEDDGKDDKLKQYFVECAEIDKFLLTYVIFKLGLINGKTLLFTNEIDRAYRLKLFLEQFGIRSAVLNSELPQESRSHIVQQFDRNYFNLLIATDESGKTGNGGNSSEYGVSRGVDFKNVACVINFDLPISSKSYVHRVGRTARANRKGMALSFVVPKDQFGKHKIASCKTCKGDEKVLARIRRNMELHPYKFDMDQVNSFRYRMEDAFRSVTKTAVREARVKEIKQELVASQQLQRHFEENPDDLAALRHDTETHITRRGKELKNVPSYLLPASAQQPQVLLNAPVRIRKKDNKKKPRSKRPRRRDPLSIGR